jgi:hypothetical protein
MIEPVEFLPIPEETVEEVEREEEEEDIYNSLVEDIHMLIAEGENRNAMVDRLLTTLTEMYNSFTPMTEDGDGESDIEGFDYVEDENED